MLKLNDAEKQLADAQDQIEWINKTLDAVAQEREDANQALMSDLDKTNEEIRNDVENAHRNGDLVVLEKSDKGVQWQWKKNVERKAKKIIESQLQPETIDDTADDDIDAIQASLDAIQS